ncbi:hypothetical protein BOX15_Mlig021091g1 [Macrostomum lignano]|uniref:Metallophos domain-containing protein n=2 Tax=Macrostomum lignano TaxID=282301 RepID=A0A1I8IZQ1_9PLAT|nr:hypothetical protein BOX15_Mlig021091g2 [Macrostomum lignano]PAA67577.1 hypothetical protein BOX15_Mlig021091g1 [Macrostomum lignano]
MPACMSICVAASGQFQASQQVSPSDRFSSNAVSPRRPALMLVDNRSQPAANDPEVPIGNSSSTSSDFAAAGCCVIGGRVRLRPEAAYVQLGDVDAPGARCVRIVHIGDSFYRKRRGGTAVELAGRIPDGDVLVHSGGDFGSDGGFSRDNGNTRASLRDRFGSILSPLLRRRKLHQLRDLLSALPHRHKILVPACDTNVGQRDVQQLLGSACHCLRNSSVTLEGVTFYGMSSAKPTEDELSAELESVDVLVSHCPPRDQELAREVFQRIRPKALLQGHSPVTDLHSETQWQDGVLLCNDHQLANRDKEATAVGKREFNKPVVIDFYTCRPMSGISQEYSEVMRSVGCKQNRSKKQSKHSECNLL